uniref:Sec-independent protein translocase component TatC n=1 Tax=Pseudellipsoidion edaphicum TaxID=1431838 RepID=A0A410D2R0_9STRA|nr:Sec-independent protein translocase component TatC [Pseudellipsoidion edaphicum]QAA12006.1 Sec-independent protein translocase component TatC [Pseudellipsoidion edaphicum]
MLFKIQVSGLEELKAPKIFMGLNEHNQELRERILQLIIFLIILLFLSLSQIKEITQFLQGAIEGIRFFQPSPDEYFFLSFKLSFSTALLLETPILLVYGVCYLFPGLFSREKFAFGSLLLLSGTLFFVASIYTYKVIAPAALTFFFSFTKDILEPLWSFQQYIDFLWTLFLGAIYCFQIPTLQIIFGFLGICNVKRCLNWIRYILLLATVIAAVITPSTDPLTQIVFASAILILYFTGTTLLFTLEKSRVIC